VATLSPESSAAMSLASSGSQVDMISVADPTLPSTGGSVWQAPNRAGRDSAGVRATTEVF
jgi:hypothetical protein